MRHKNMTAEQIRQATPCTERWVQDALKHIGEPGLDANNNSYAYMLREFELTCPTWARILIPLFARPPVMPWWKRPVMVVNVSSR